MCGTHTSVDDPPSASVFSRESKRPSSGLAANSSLNDVVSGMMTVMSSLCQALVPKPSGPTCSSPVKKAELRGTYMYMKQLTELKQFQDGGILDEEEDEEQRLDIIKLMRQLNQK